MFDEVIEVIEGFHGNVHDKKQMSQTLIVLKSNLSGNVPYPDSDQFDNFKRFFTGHVRDVHAYEFHGSLAGSVLHRVLRTSATISGAATTNA